MIAYESKYFKDDLIPRPHVDFNPLYTVGAGRNLYHTTNEKDPQSQHGYILRPSLYHLSKIGMDETALQQHCSLMYLQPSKEELNSGKFFYIKQAGDRSTVDAKKQELLQVQAQVRLAQESADRKLLAQSTLNQNSLDSTSVSSSTTTNTAVSIDKFDAEVCKLCQDTLEDPLISKNKFICCSHCWLEHLSSPESCSDASHFCKQVDVKELKPVHICFVCDNVLTSKQPPYQPECKHELCEDCWRRNIANNGRCYEVDCSVDVSTFDLLKAVPVDYI
jgi:hypothetical protein